MIDKIREKLLDFINSGKDTPLLAGFSIGLYMMLFYYARNFGLANSWEQLLFFSAYYVLLPVAVIFGFYKIMGYIKLAVYRRQFVFTAMAAFLSYFLIQLLEKPYFIVFVIIAGAVILSLWAAKYYKLAIILLFLMSVLNVKPLAGAAYKFITASGKWKKLPDDIEKVVFKHKPNIYYIQPDGYTSFNNLRHNPHYGFDNTAFEAFLKQNGFTLYDNCRSNYPSTLLSNSATFSMKHHYIARDVETYGARGIIVGDNPVLRILKNNGYYTSFITQNTYLIMNRPHLGYDYCNINYNDIPHIKDGFVVTRDVLADFKRHMSQQSKSPKFYFVERFLPAHIAVNNDGKTVEEERQIYMGRLKQSNDFLKEIVNFIIKNDPTGLIIIGADHGGYIGFSSMSDLHNKTQDESLIYSVFGAHLSVRWNSGLAKEYDKELKTNVNLFRTVFSVLAEEEKYLQHMEDNSSYMPLHNPKGKYKYIDSKGNIIFEPL